MAVRQWTRPKNKRVAGSSESTGPGLQLFMSLQTQHQLLLACTVNRSLNFQGEVIKCIEFSYKMDLTSSHSFSCTSVFPVWWGLNKVFLVFHTVLFRQANIQSYNYSDEANWEQRDEANCPDIATNSKTKTLAVLALHSPLHVRPFSFELLNVNTFCSSFWSISLIDETLKYNSGWHSSLKSDLTRGNKLKAWKKEEKCFQKKTWST